MAISVTVPRARGFRLRVSSATALSAALLAAALAASPAAAQEALRPAIGKPLLSAKSFLAAHNYAKAMAAVRAADAVPGKTAHETLVIEQMRAAIAQESGDTTTAAAAYQQLLASGQLPPGEAAKLMQGEVSIAFKQKNYANVVYWADRYLKAGGTEPGMRTYLIQGYYLQGKYAEAAKLQIAQIQAETRGGRAPVEAQLQLLYSCQTHLGDKTGQLATIKQLVTYYPKPDYWLNVIDNIRTKPGFPDRLLLDVYRLEFSLNLVNKPDDAMDMAELALQAKLPGLAKEIVDKCFASGLLGTGPQAPRQLRLKALVEKTYDADRKALGQEDAAAAGERDGNALLALGETYVSYGMFDKGLPMMQAAMQKDSLLHPEDAKLQLGLAYWAAGQKPKAIATLKTVGGTDGAGDLAQLWLLRFRQP
jgi:tetratricopeptide (TPR) repeat protein